MEKININQVEPIGMPLYEMKKFFMKQGDFKEVSMSVISLASGERIPAVGMSCHDEDEYSYIFSGEVNTYCNGEYSVEKAGDATLIPAGEEHWCINNGSEPCMLVCFMVKRAE
ncbi:MAG TPA: cupin domain-containing protein [Neobacillus sp.]|jgi:quercetin dioxygenase-like cupin family protein